MKARGKTGAAFELLYVVVPSESGNSRNQNHMPPTAFRRSSYQFLLSVVACFSNSCMLQNNDVELKASTELETCNEKESNVWLCFTETQGNSAGCNICKWTFGGNTNNRL